MDWFWTWGGIPVGYRNGDDLYTRDGRHVAQFRDDEVFTLDGRYLGEIRSEQRLVTKLSKRSRRVGSRARMPNRSPSAARVTYVANVPLVGHEDFPEPQTL